MKKQIRPELLICALAFGALCFLGGFFAGRNSLRPLDAVLAETAKTAADTEEAQDPDTEPAEPDTPAAEAADTRCCRAFWTSTPISTAWAGTGTRT